MTDFINYNNANNIINSSYNPLTARYNSELLDLYKNKANVNTCIDDFIDHESELLKERMLSVYERVCPSKVAKLQNVLSSVAHGPIKMPNVSLIDEDREYRGTLIYYSYLAHINASIQGSCIYRKRILALMYKDADGKTATKYYGLNIEHNNYTRCYSNDIPSSWFKKMSAISEAGAGPLIEFLKEDYDLGELGDKYNAIVDFYDVEAKLRTGVDYYWMKHKKEQAQREMQLLDELRTATMLYENRTGIDIQQHEWEHVQGLLQKALVALQMV